MRLPVLVVCLLASGVSAFSPAVTTRKFASSLCRVEVGLSAESEDCGCGGAVISGKPSDKARSLNPRDAIGKSTLRTLDGIETSLNDILPQKGTSLLVITRSLG